MAQVEVKAHGEVSGYFVISTDKRGEIARFPNLITNGGLDRMGGSSDWLSWCQVGSGSTAPNFNDSGLVNRIAASETRQASTAGAQSAEPYFCWRRNTYRFAQGVAAGNLSEVGVGWASTGSLFSRALILDAQGQPTTITIQSDETLDVTYEFRYYPKTTDDTGQVVLTGNIGGTYSWIFRALGVTSNDPNIGWNIGTVGTMASDLGNSISNLFFDGYVGAITSGPSGQSSSSSALAAGYSAGSHELAVTISASLDQGNFAAGIGALRAKMGIGTYQIGFTPKIPKTANDILSIVVKHSWARRP